MQFKKILVVEDDPDIADLVQLHLEKEGFRVLVANEGEKGLELAQKENPDLVILDWMLPGMSGIDICKALKADTKTQGISVMMLTARTEESDIVAGMELGADDYVTKPFSPRVLMARVRAILRRNLPGSEAEIKSVEKSDETKIKIHGLSIDLGRHKVKSDEQLLDLTHLEYSLLCLLSKRPGWVFSRMQIVEGVRGGEYPVTERSVDVVVTGLRKKMGDKALLIETVRGSGYRFKDLD